MNRLKNILISILHTTKHILFEQKAEVILYYPQHFNRDSDGKNLYYKQLIEALNESNIKYTLIEEPDYTTPMPRDREAIPFDALFWIITVIRKILRVLLTSNFIKQEAITATVINIITLNKFRVDNYITISGSMQYLFASINKNGKVYDLQHGIIDSQQPKFFDNNKRLIPLKQHYKNLGFLLYGDGFKDLFFINRDNIAELKDRVYNIGFPIKSSSSNNYTDNTNKTNIVFASQILKENGETSINEQKRVLKEFAESLDYTKVNLLIKNHPRFNNATDMSEIYAISSSITETMQSIPQLAKIVALHITFYSTSTFDFAAYGVPTAFLYSKLMPQGIDIFYNDYKYPLYKNDNIVDVINRLSDTMITNEEKTELMVWYKKFYSEFNKEKFISIIKAKL